MAVPVMQRADLAAAAVGLVGAAVAAHFRRVRALERGVAAAVMAAGPRVAL